ncbi:MAG: hypothetical protein WA477_11750 [Candidatus Sulfotelmatobacter sp.]
MSKQKNLSFAWINQDWIKQLWQDEEGQDIAEYSVMLAVILVIVVGTVRMIGSNSSTVFSQVGSSLQ